jgi:(R,R)-butanediol dehydrogenase/meso-butanediol dehydrogenase/diacetyl reductase
MSTMNAIMMQDGAINLERVSIPEPTAGQVLVRSLACGICGSDIHLARHSDEVFDFYRKIGVMPAALDDHTPVMLGHEFCAEIVRYGPDTQQVLPIGDRVTSVPILLSQNAAGVGVTPGISGAYSEYFILDEALLLSVPEHVPATAATLAEPLAVGLHAVNRSKIKANDTALIVGCGSIGLAVISALKLKGIRNIVAADLQVDKLSKAKVFGASITVNPSQQDEVAFATEYAGDSGGNGRLVIFECVGLHTLIDSFIRRAPAHATLVVTGIHTATASINYAYATIKELDILFSYYYHPEEFSECLNNLTDGKIPWQEMLTGNVGIDGVSDAFEQLMKPNNHIKVVIEPWRNGKLQKN